jgi:hypothetical protein
MGPLVGVIVYASCLDRNAHNQDNLKVGMVSVATRPALTAVQEFRQPCFFPGNREIFKKNREAIEHERAITERD